MLVVNVGCMPHFRQGGEVGLGLVNPPLTIQG